MMQRNGTDRWKIFSLYLFLTVALFLAFPLRPAYSAITKVQDIGTASSKTSGTTLSVAVPAAGVAAGNSIIVTFAMDVASGNVSCSDTANNTYSVDVDVTNAGNVRTVILSAHNVFALSSGNTIWITHPSVTARAMSVAEFSGLAVELTKDQTKSATGTGTSPSSGATSTTIYPSELLIGAIGVEGPIEDSFTPGASWTALNRAGTSGNPAASNITINSEYRIVPAHGTYQADGTITSRDWAAAIATYREGCDAGFSYRRTITIDYTKVGGSSNLTDFPLLVRESGNWLKDVSTDPSNGQIQTRSGYDIIFRDTDGNQLYHEFENYDSSTGSLVAWVKVPTVYYNSNTTIYMDYGNKCVPPTFPDSTQVWKSSYKGVYHLKEDRSGTGNLDLYQDSTSNNKDGDDYVNITGKTGQIYNGQEFNNPLPDLNRSHIDFGSGAFTFGTTFTISAWLYVTKDPDNLADNEAYIHTIFSNEDTIPPNGTLSFRIGSKGDPNLKRRLALMIFTADAPNSARDFESASDLYTSLNTWNYGVVTYDGTYVKFYINGNLDNTQDRTVLYPGSESSLASNSNIWVAGCTSNDMRHWEGNIDELRISNEVLPDNWIRAEYNNQKTNQDLYSLSDWSSVTSVKLSSFTARSDQHHVDVLWVTKSEINNLGFNLYRSTEGGPLVRLNSERIPGLFSSALGRKYTYEDREVTPGISYCYTLEDIDLSGTKTRHGPVCVTWTLSTESGQIDAPAAAAEKPSGSVPTDTPERFLSGDGRGNAGGNTNATPQEGSGFEGMITTGRATRVILTSFTALQGDEGILLEWSTGQEVDNLGFHVYREENGSFTRLTPQLIAGSAFRAGARTVTAGFSYSWLDSSALSTQPSVPPPSPSRPEGEGRGGGAFSPPSSALKYWIEDLDLKGKRTWHGPVSPTLSDQPLSKKTQSALLSHMTRHQAAQDGGPLRLQSRLRKARHSIHPFPSPPRSRGRERVAGPQSSILSTNIVVSDVDDGNGTLVGGQAPPILSDRPLANPAEIQRSLAASQAVKIFIQQEGWYRITQPELLAAGLPRSVNPRFLQLFLEGKEQPLVVNGERDGSFDPQDSVEFYGKGLDPPYTDAMVYWLVVGSRPGKRIHPAERGIGSRQGSSSFSYTVEEKPRTIYFPALMNGDADNFFGPVVSNDPVEQVLTLKNVDPSYPGEALLEVALYGLSLVPHQVKILLNGTEAGVLTFGGQSRGLARIPILQTALMQGENRVTLIAQGGEEDVSLIDSLRLTYRHTYTADEDSLRMTAEGGTLLSIHGFSSSRIRVMDITNPLRVQEVNGVVSPRVPGFAVRFRVPGQGERTLLAFAEEKVKEPAALDANLPSAWHQATNGADIVMITHESFLQALRPLKALREAQGLSVALIDVEDLYDEFSFGMKTPQAIQDFLSRARASWQKAPRFVVLVGDATYDPRNYLGYGNFDLVPTKLVETAYLETACDDCLADFNGDGLPEMAVGRLPVRTLEEAQTIVSKILAYEESSGRLTEALFVADIQDDDFSFEGASSSSQALLPADMSIREVFRSRFGDDDQVQAAIREGINRGPLLVNYFGHGSLEIWRGSVFTTADISALTNRPQFSFFVPMTCLNGYFHEAYPIDSLAEALLKTPNGGAVAVWASSGLTEPTGQQLMNEELMRQLFNGESLTLGEAAMRAKGAVSDQDVRRTWILFGDPTTRLKY